MRTSNCSVTADEIDGSETQRLQALARYEILDTPAESEFDHLVQLAAGLCNAPIAVVNFIAEDRQWFKAEVGIGNASFRWTCRSADMRS